MRRWDMVQMKQLFGTIARSTSAPAGYDQIDDTSEGRLKVHAEEAFKAGIKFKARFIGSLEIPKVQRVLVSKTPIFFYSRIHESK